MGRTRLYKITIKLTKSEMEQIGLSENCDNAGTEIKRMLFDLPYKHDKYIKLKDKEIGKKGYSTNHERIEIVDYRNHNDLDVAFPDGSIAYGCTMSSFEREMISHPKNLNHHIGESVVCKNGQKACIIGYNNANDITIQFEDGTKVTHKYYGNFKRGSIANPNFVPHLNEINKNGDRIIDYKGYNNVSVKKNDGTIVNTSLNVFQRGGPEKKQSNPYISRATNGEIIEAINFKNERDFDVLFKSGIIKHCKSYNNFKKRRIHPPKDYSDAGKHIGEIIKFNNGVSAYIISYESFDNVSVKISSTGEIINKCRYSSIKKGHYPKHANQEGDTSLHYGKKLKFNNGVTGIVIAYHNYHNVDVQLSDGVILKGCNYNYITKGYFPYSKLDMNNVAHWKYDSKRKKNNIYKAERVGEEIILSNGVICKITQYYSIRDVSIKFPNGYVVSNCDYTSLKKGHIPKKKIKEQGLQIYLKEYI